MTLRVPVRQRGLGCISAGQRVDFGYVNDEVFTASCLCLRLCAVAVTHEANQLKIAGIESDRPDRVVWSSLWVKRPDARVHFDMQAARGGTDLRWTLHVDETVPDRALTIHMCKPMGELINANLRYTYGH
jgi:hypothetical protein